MQGPTSTGKTSLVAHLAAQTGHRCVRINNHEQTDLQVQLLCPPADSVIQSAVHVQCAALIKAPLGRPDQADFAASWKGKLGGFQSRLSQACHAGVPGQLRGG